ncbi:KLTH0B06248p [Lachancea thermotolerans CBS 6340]|uniref:KLTH0B06248p n=1 Tax=Lachancea thermotolerans (strain ATCC 56472 / CBS 6340 / NRRL Y-8284) TaxID=559295 RepID=C5DCW1_LACTC|nr:KLTH0B06248p [Lachancea thermotolerans CBS 6340]CAR21622.1 KLTH0B06248p [Lachancea thermotolerans CBS 6340]
MTSFGTYRTMEDPELLFQFSTPLVGSSRTLPTGISAGEPSSRWPGFDASPRAAAADDEERDGDAATLQGSGASICDEAATLYSHTVKRDTPAESGARSEAPWVNAAAIGSGYAPHPLKSGTASVYRSNAALLSRFNNALSKSFSSDQLHQIERMVDEFWLRESALTEDMFEDSSDEE